MAITSNGTGGGNYSAGASWAGGVVPTITVADAIVANGDEIIVDTTGLGCGTDPGTGTDGLTIQSGGILNHSTTANSELTVRGETTVESGGTLCDGTQSANNAFSHKFIIDCVATNDKYGITLKDGCFFKPYGADVTIETKLAADFAAAQADIVVEDDVQTAGWAAGNEIAVPPTGVYTNYGQTEIRTINAFASGTELDVTVNWTYAHTYKQHASCPQTSVVLLTRNVQFSSLSASFRANIRNQSQTAANVDIKNVEFINMGTSLKRTALVFCSSSRTTDPVYTLSALGSFNGCSFHGAYYCGFFLCLYGNTSALAFDDNVVVQTGVASTGYLCYVDGFSDFFSFDRLFAIGYSGSTSAKYFLWSGTNCTLTNSVFAGSYWGFRAPAITTSGCFVHTNRYAGWGYVLSFTAFKDNYIINSWKGMESSYSTVLVTDENSVYALNYSDIDDLGSGYFDKVSLLSGIPVRFNATQPGMEIGCHQLDNVPDKHVTFSRLGTIQSCKGSFASPNDIVHTVGSLGMLLEPLLATIPQSIQFEIAGTSGNQIVVSGRIRKTAAYNGSSEPTVTLSGIGITEDVFTKADVADAWELFVVSGTPTSDGIAFIDIECIGTAGYVYVDTLVLTAADVNTGDMDNWGKGRPTKGLYATKVDAAAIAVVVADAVADELLAEHTDAGSLAQGITDILTDTNELQTDIKDGGRTDLILDTIAVDVAGIDGDAMRGTNGANTTTPPTAAAVVNEWEGQSQADPTGFHVNVLEVGGTPQTANDNGADINDILADTETDGVLLAADQAVDVTKISGDSTAADNLKASAKTIVIGTVSHDNTASSETVFYADDITEATADHFKGRIVIFTSGALIYQVTDITGYALVSGEGQFTVSTLTESPADNITFIIL